MHLGKIKGIIIGGGLVVLVCLALVIYYAEQPDDDDLTDHRASINILPDENFNQEHDQPPYQSETRFEDIPIPDLPFDDNPDPNECGIPQQWGTRNNTAWLTGIYEGDLIQPTVYLYDSHGRNAITALAPHGTQVEIVLFQANPVLNYYFVRIPSAPLGYREGWIPAPFLSLEPLLNTQS